jgi:choline dehydrogenase-like flavoprotein
MAGSPEIVIIGSGIGGGTLANRLVQYGLNVTILERGGYLPQEPQNWDVASVFFDKRYVPQETWLDKEGTPFRPGTYYYVGGSSKMYGAAMLRLRERDFQDLEHVDGVSPGWPITYQQLAPYYDLAERLYLVHGQAGVDPTEPPGIPPYPYPALTHEPVIEKVASALSDQGIKPFSLPLAVQRHQGGPCIRCKTCDGFPCRVHAKTDAEIAAVKPALATGKLTLTINAKARRILLTSDGRRVNAVEYEHNSRIERIAAPVVVLAASAVNSAVLLLRSACDRAPRGVANSSGLVGRNYMAHNNTALMSVGWAINDTNFQNEKHPPGVAAKGVLPDGHSRTSAADSESRTAIDGMDQSQGIGQGRAEGATGVRLCTLGAQGARTTQGGVQAGSGEIPDGEGNRAVGDPLFQGLQESTTGDRARPGGSGPDARDGQISRVLLGDDLCGLPGRRLPRKQQRRLAISRSDAAHRLAGERAKVAPAGGDEGRC